MAAVDINFFRNLKIRWKILLLVLPLVVVPIVIVANITGYIASTQAYRGITDTSKDDLDHMARFTIGLLTMHDRTSGRVTGGAAFGELKGVIKEMRVGETGYIYCMDRTGTLTVHPAQEGHNIFDAKDYSGFPFIQEMLKNRNGWIRYPWQNPGERGPRMKIVRYVYFEPWDWIVAVGSYENEFYKEANLIQRQIASNMILIVVLASVVAVLLVFWVSSRLTNPIREMIAVLRKIKDGALDERMAVAGSDEIGELADNFNRMIEMIQQQKEMEQTLSQHSKMASLGVLASQVAHEINNPLGVILGYASYMESKLEPSDPSSKYIAEMKRESQRCKKIVENFLNYARIPSPVLKPVDINALITEIAGFASRHPDVASASISTEFDRTIPTVMADEDQIKQVAINLILNAAAAIRDAGGRITISTGAGLDGYVNIIFRDTGKGIPEEDLSKIFEPFYTTKQRGTGLGLAIVRQIVKQHLGNILVESRLDAGTSVIVSLPVTRE